jgi:hypothetical protein
MGRRMMLRRYGALVIGDGVTKEELKAAREECGLSLADWAYALGYRHASRDAARQQAYEMEIGRKAITPQVARLAEMFRRHGVPDEWLAAPVPSRPI